MESQQDFKLCSVLGYFLCLFTLVFLSWLIEETKDINLIAVTGIIIIAGLILFLLPPIPGVPIYLTSGIVLTSVVGRDSLGSITAAIAYPCAVSLGLKLLARTLQQVSMGVLCFQHRLIRQFLA